MREPHHLGILIPSNSLNFCRNVRHVCVKAELTGSSQSTPCSQRFWSIIFAEAKTGAIQPTGSYNLAISECICFYRDSVCATYSDTNDSSAPKSSKARTVSDCPFGAYNTTQAVESNTFAVTVAVRLAVCCVFARALNDSVLLYSNAIANTFVTDGASECSLQGEAGVFGSWIWL